MKKLALLTAFLLVTACGQEVVPVPQDLKLQAHQSVAAELASDAPVMFGDTWFVGGDPALGAICGEIERPRGLGNRPVRFLYAFEGGFSPVIEPLTLVDDPSPQIIATKVKTVEVIAEFWLEHCEPSRPGSGWWQ